MRYFTADLHLGHEAILGYTDRGHASLDEMHDDLVARWNETVEANDEIWVVGDVAKGDIEWSLSVVSRLRGRKVLVAGNHDRCHPIHGPDALRWADRYLDAGFDLIIPTHTHLRIGAHTVDVCHFPPSGDNTERDRHEAYRPAPTGGWLIHGHVHEQWRRRGRWINVGVDVWDLRPVAETRLAAMMDAVDAGIDELGEEYGHG